MVSGNIEVGSRYGIPSDEWWWEDIIDVDVEDEDYAYNFDKGYLQVQQKVNKKLDYSVKYHYNKKDYRVKDIDNRMDYYTGAVKYKFIKEISGKFGFYLRNQNFTDRPTQDERDNITYTPYLELRTNPLEQTKLILSYRYKDQTYKNRDEKEKDKITNMALLKVEQKFFKDLTLNARWKMDFRHYKYRDVKNLLKRSVSFGFKYQF